MITIDLNGKTAVVTGASRGLGATTACRLHAAGANVVLNYFPDDQGHHQQLANQLKNTLGERVSIFAADVRDRQACSDLIIHACQSFGGLDYLVNNAGILRDKTMRRMEPADWQDVIDTNLTGVFQMCQAAADRMRTGGRIINLASISAIVGFFGQANYASAKAGVIGLTKVLSRELAKKEINVNAIAPGVILTDMGKSIPDTSLQQMLQQIPLGRFGQPEDIANAILFLCSPLADYITGQTLHVNGGWIG